MDVQQQEAERMRIKQIMHRAKQDIEKIFMRMEQELSADLSQPAPIFTQIEQYFARPFSGIELETIRDWMDRYQPDLITVALREAALRNVRNVRYIDRILLNWEKAGITDPKAAMKHSAKFNQRTPTQQQPPQEAQEPQRKKAPFYNWLEERE